MEKFEQQGGIAFLLIYYTAREELYYMQYRQIRRFWDRAEAGGRKSFRLDELEPDWFMKLQNGFLFLILIPSRRIWTRGIDRSRENPYNYKRVLTY